MYFSNMGIGLPTSERKDRLQRNLCGSLDYVRVTCILLLNSGYTPLVNLIVLELTLPLSTTIAPLIFTVV